ncbi:MAG TPA: hypothetical protein VLH79_16340 [Chthonomonadales bacterium]|nr:hypothetical protein [Chthonomonadales bacterium]
MPRRRRPDPGTWADRFLDEYRRTGLLARSARAVGVTPQAVRMRRKRSDAFASAMADAAREAGEALEAEAWRRAVEGVDRPVFYGGQEAGHVRVYSDRLLALLLKAHLPERYGGASPDRGDDDGAPGLREVTVEPPEPEDGMTEADPDGGDALEA